MDANDYDNFCTVWTQNSLEYAYGGTNYFAVFKEIVNLETCTYLWNTWTNKSESIQFHDDLTTHKKIVKNTLYRKFVQAGRHAI